MTWPKCRDLTIALLNLAQEESEICQVIGELGSLKPELSNLEKFELAQSLVSTYLEKGWIEIYEHVWPYGDWTPVPKEDREKIINSKAFWEPPNRGEIAYIMDTTDLGKAQLFRKKPDQ